MLYPTNEYPGENDTHDYLRDAANEVAFHEALDPTYLARQIGQMIGTLHYEEWIDLGAEIERSIILERVSFEIAFQKELRNRHIRDVASKLYDSDMDAFSSLTDSLDTPEPFV